MRLLAFVALAASLLNYLRIRALWVALLYVPRLFAGAFAPEIGLLGLLAAWRGRRSRLTQVAGGVAAALAFHYTERAMWEHPAFETAFGDDWRAKITRQQTANMLRGRWTPRMPAPRQPRIEHDCVYWTLPENNRPLLCDLWLPPWDVPPSGLGMIFMHGSAWHYGDKDMGTDVFFSHLAQQGHLIMDLAYRLAPEADIFAQVGDVKRAIHWLKANAERYRVNPERIVLAGGSAGGHLALLAAYTPDDERLTPEDVDDDLSVHGVVSYYGPADVRAVFANGEMIFRDNPRVNDTLTRIFHLMGLMTEGDAIISPAIMMRNLLGALPEDDPETYALVSPINHVSPRCPPTLLLQGSEDWLVPAEGARQLHRKLVEAGVQAAYVEFDHTDHGFDLIAPRWSPSAQASFYDVERFLALLV